MSTHVPQQAPQPQFQPQSVERQVLVVYAATNGHIDQLPTDAVGRYERELLAFVESKHPQILADLREKRELTDDIKKRLNVVLEEFKGRFAA